MSARPKKSKKDAAAADAPRNELQRCQREFDECRKRLKETESFFANEITERRQSEEKLNRLNAELSQQAAELQALNKTLLDREQRLRIAVETGKIGLFVWDSTEVTNPGDWSNQLKEIFGLPLDAEVTHDMFLKCVHPADRDHIDQCVQNALKGENGGEYRTEYRTIRPDDGSEHWVVARGQAFFNAEGQAFRFIGTVMDITERKRAEQFLSQLNIELEERISLRLAELARTNEALQSEVIERKRAEEQLRQSQAYLAEAQRLSRTGSFGWDVTTGNLVWSDETFCIFGYNRTLKPTLELALRRVHPQDAAVVRQTLDHAARDGTNLDFEHRLLTPDGEVKYIHVLAQPAKTESGVLTFVGAIMDITESKKAAESLHASEHLARGQLDALKRTLDALSKESEPEKFLEHVLRTITEQMDAHSIGVWEINKSTGGTGFVANFENDRFQFTPEEAEASPKAPTWEREHPIWTQFFLEGKFCVAGNLDADPPKVRIENGQDTPWHNWGVDAVSDSLLSRMIKRLSASGIISTLCVPMFVAGRVTGLISIRFKQRRAFQREEIELIRALSHQAALAIQLTRLSQQSRQSAVMAERNRMARDIHDTLAQGFTGVIMQVEAAKGAASRGELSVAAAHIERAESLARVSLGEARRSVRALRPRSLREGNLCMALEDLLKRLSEGTALRAELRVDGDERVMPQDWEEGLLRIAQESLTNTLKHAKAGNFRATLHFGPEKIQLQLADDGCGFDSKTESEGFGLIGMKERVDQMSGQFILRSKPGQGTEILVILSNPAAPNAESENEKS